MYRSLQKTEINGSMKESSTKYSSDTDIEKNNQI